MTRVGATATPAAEDTATAAPSRLLTGIAIAQLATRATAPRATAPRATAPRATATGSPRSAAARMRARVIIPRVTACLVAIAATSLATTCLLALVAAPAAAQTLQWEDYEPRSTLVVPEHPTPRARFPFVDVHSHHRQSSPAYLDAVVRDMDAMNMAILVNLSGGSGDRLAETVRAMKARHPGRFAVFANLDFSGIDQPGWGERAAAQLERDVRAGGAQGLKIFKSLGMSVRDANGRVATNDRRLDPVWTKAGELGIPVLIHTADPAPFWQPHDRHNERWYELKEIPGRKQEAPPSWETLMAEQHDVFRTHPRTRFIAAHLDWMGNDLGRLGRLLDELPNVYTEIGAVLAELGRQPRTARAFLTRYQDRVLFGKDAWAPAEYPVYFRTLETADEYFDYYRKRHAFWKLYGLDLPDAVLRKLYYENALRLIPGLDRSLFP